MNDAIISSALGANAASTGSAASSGKAHTKPAVKAASASKTPAKAPRKTAAKAPQRKPDKSAKAAVTPPAAPAKAKTSPAKAPQPKASDNKNTAAPAKAPKEKKIKVVRDSFTLPKTELLQITEMKKRAMTLGVEVKKSELIRAGLQALAGMADTAFKKAMASVPTIKTGRPAKD
ncbi:MAG: hypothetical protein ACK5V9_14205 [Burkholderiales bacterium]